jgi:hypothetical protein
MNLNWHNGRRKRTASQHLLSCTDLSNACYAERDWRSVYRGSFVFAIALLAAVTAVAQSRITAAETLRLVNRVGPHAAVRQLFDSPAWEPILQGIGGGGEGWLRVAAALEPGSDAHSSEELSSAVSEALRRNPRGVLRLVKRGTFSVSNACGWLGFNSFGEGSDAQVYRFIADAKRAVEGLTDQSLKEERRECLAQLATLKPLQ